MVYIVLYDEWDWNYGVMTKARFYQKMRSECLDSGVLVPNKIVGWPNHLVISVKMVTDKLLDIVDRYCTNKTILPSESN